jgi:hypothetical protein
MVTERRRFGPRVVVENRRSSISGREKPEEHVDRGRLPGPVRAEKAVDLPSFDREVQTTESSDVSEPLGGSVEVDSVNYPTLSGFGTLRVGLVRGLGL